MTMQELFEKYLPAINEMDVVTTLQMNGPLVTVQCRTDPRRQVFIAKFSTAGAGSFPVLVMNRLTAQKLHRHLSDAGYGAKGPQDEATE
jgi:hypothetical protein